MRKRIISLVLAVVMICAMAISASARNVDYTADYVGSTGTCTYHLNGNCKTTSWSFILEWTYSTDSYKNYTFKINVTPYGYYIDGSDMPLPPSGGASATLLAENSYNATDYIITSVDVECFVNGSSVYTTNISAG